MIDTTLIDKLTVLANQEKKIKEFKRRFRIKGKVVKKSDTKKGNITLTIEKDKQRYKITVLKSHKEKYALANKMIIGNAVSAEGIPRLKYIICTRLKLLEKGIADGKQGKLNNYTE